jgi:hypothetical protein
VLRGNQVFPSDAGFGGGAYNCSLNSCLLLGNSGGVGGAVHSGISRNCTIVGNTAPFGGEAGGGKAGGAAYATLVNCIVYFNTAGSGSFPYNFLSCTQSSCCTFPTPTNGFNINTNDPVFIDYAGGNFRLQSNSPCIDIGDGMSAGGSVDLDGLPRFRGGNVDLGAYEYQGPGAGEFTRWLEQHGLATDGSANYADSDGDGLNNWQEWRAGTDPTDALSVLRMLQPTVDPSGVSITWQSISGRFYFVQRADGFAVPLSFQTIQSNIFGNTDTTTFIDPTLSPGGLVFYRVGVE